MTTRQWPKPRPFFNPPRGVFSYNGGGGCDFIENRLYLWQLVPGPKDQPEKGYWHVIDGPRT